MLDKYSKLHKYDCIVHKSNGVKIKKNMHNWSSDVLCARIR
jgi:hypothetical protein